VSLCIKRKPPSKMAPKMSHFLPLKMGNRRPLMTDVKGRDAWIQEGIQQMKAALEARDQTDEPVSEKPSEQSSPLARADLDATGIHRRHLEIILDAAHMKTTTSLLATLAFLQDDATWCLLLAGETGVGKTFAAEWALVELLRKKTSPRKKPSARYTQSRFFAERGLMPNL